MRTQFPNLINFLVTSQATTTYNCIAWAFRDNTKWWWPDGYSYWPPNLPCTNSVRDFDELFSTLNAITTPSESLEAGFVKIALFALAHEPKHAARQLGDGSWTSKLGKNIDISHPLRELEGPAYGSVIRIYNGCSSLDF